VIRCTECKSPLVDPGPGVEIEDHVYCPCCQSNFVVVMLENGHPSLLPMGTHAFGWLKKSPFGRPIS
jgi:uncharacterized Zn finger protein (UPF0148 family)